VRRPPALGDDVPVPQQHQAVQFDGRVRIHRIDEREHGSWVHALLHRPTARELAHDCQHRHRRRDVMACTRAHRTTIDGHFAPASPAERRPSPVVRQCDGYQAERQRE
jgi:hypothetical protein